MKRITLKEILNGSIMTRESVRKQYRLLGLIAALAFLYIYCGYVCQHQKHRTGDLKKELQDADYELLTLEAELTDMTRQSSVETELQSRGSRLKTNTQPVIRIR
jgi:hypothetical protein